MLLLPLICIVIMAWCLQNAVAAIANGFGGQRVKILKRLPKETAPLVQDQILLVAMDPSPLANRTQSLIFQSLRLRNWRVNLMQFCFADVAMWGVFAACSVFFQIGAVFVLAAGGLLLLLTPFLKNFTKPAASLAMNFGFFLLTAELALRTGGMAMGHDVSELSMLLADNRPLALVGMTAAMAMIVAFTGCEFLGFSAALLGLASGAVSLNGAVAFVWGEHIGLSLRLYFESRGHSASIRKMTKMLLLGNLGAWPVALLILGFLRDGLMVSAPTQEELLTSLAIFLLLSAVTLIPFAAAGLAQGHWMGKKSPDDLMEKPGSMESWLRSTSFRSSLIAFVLFSLRQRQDEIERLRNNFGETDWQKVPKPVREASEREAEHLHRSRQSIEAHLLSRSDFFNHQLR